MNPIIKKYKKFYEQGRLLLALASKTTYLELDTVDKNIQSTEEQLTLINHQILILGIEEFSSRKSILEEEYDKLEKELYSYIVLGIETVRAKAENLKYEN